MCDKTIGPLVFKAVTKDLEKVRMDRSRQEPSHYVKSTCRSPSTIS